MPIIEIVEADLSRPDHREAVTALVDHYARDPMGQGRPLDPDVRARLGEGLRSHSTSLVLLAFLSEQPVGVAVCFLGYSTFAARPLLNIHDLAVLPAHRGRGIGRALLEAVERAARERGCCKVTLEVYATNERARRAYAAAGFEPGPSADPQLQTLFLTKPL